MDPNAQFQYKPTAPLYLPKAFASKPTPPKAQKVVEPSPLANGVIVSTLVPTFATGHQPRTCTVDESTVYDPFPKLASALPASRLCFDPVNGWLWGLTPHALYRIDPASKSVVTNGWPELLSPYLGSWTLEGAVPIAPATGTGTGSGSGGGGGGKLPLPPTILFEDNMRMYRMTLTVPVDVPLTPVQLDTLWDFGSPFTVKTIIPSAVALTEAGAAELKLYSAAGNVTESAMAVTVNSSLRSGATEMYRFVSVPKPSAGAHKRLVRIDTGHPLPEVPGTEQLYGWTPTHVFSVGKPNPKPAVAPLVIGGGGLFNSKSIAFPMQSGSVPSHLAEVYAQSVVYDSDCNVAALSVDISHRTKSNGEFVVWIASGPADGVTTDWSYPHIDRYQRPYRYAEILQILEKRVTSFHAAPNTLHQLIASYACVSADNDTSDASGSIVRYPLIDHCAVTALCPTPSGLVLFANSLSESVYVLTPATGAISLFAGLGRAGTTSEHDAKAALNDTPALKAVFDGGVSGLILDEKRRMLYVCHNQTSIRRIQLPAAFF